MGELARCLIGGGFWVLVLFLLTAAVARRAGKSVLGPAPLMISYPIFYFCQIALARMLDYAGVLNAPAVLIAHLAAAAALSAYLLVTRPETLPGEPENGTARSDLLVKRTALAFAALLILALAGLSLVTPMRVRDVLGYHGPMVASYYQNGALAPWATQDLRQIFRVNGTELQMLNLAFLAGSDGWLEVQSVIALVVCLAASFEIARIALGRRDLAFLCAVLVLTAPQVLIYGAAAKHDLVLTATILCSLYWLLRTVTTASGKTLPALMMLSMCVALACATKPNGVLLVAAVLGTLILLALVRRARPGHAVWFAVLAAAFALLLAGPAYRRGFAASSMRFGLAPGENVGTFAIGVSTWAAVARFYAYELCFKRPVFNWLTHGATHYGYLFPFVLLAGVFVAVREAVRIRQARQSELWIVAIFSIMLFCATTVAREPEPYDGRFMLWMIPCLGTLSCSLLRRAKGDLILIGVAVCGGFAVCGMIDILTVSPDAPVFRDSVRHLLKERELALLVDVRPFYVPLDGYAALERHARDGDRVLYVGGPSTVMYPCWGRRFGRRVTGVDNLDDAERKVQARECRFVVVEHKTARPLKEGAIAAARRSGHRVIAEGATRTVFMREATAPVERLLEGGRGPVR